MKKLIFLLPVLLVLIGCADSSSQKMVVQSTSPAKSETNKVAAENKVVIKVMPIAKGDYMMYYFSYAIDFDSIQAVMDADGYNYANTSDLKKCLRGGYRLHLVDDLPIIALKMPTDGYVALAGPGFMKFQASVFNGREIVDDFFDVYTTKNQNFWFLAVRDRT